uniref:Putative secreted protein n=1 Tax=Anopheles darlingi TaxID=43151 RepID=A0A2M4DCY6_ANODA
MLLPRVIVRLPVLQSSAAAKALHLIALAGVEESRVARLLWFRRHRRWPSLERFQPRGFVFVHRIFGTPSRSSHRHRGRVAAENRRFRFSR